MDEVFIKLADFPTNIHGYTVRDCEGDYNIFINSRITREEQILAYNHELKHIQGDDYNTKGSVDLIEIHVHKSGGRK